MDSHERGHTLTRMKVHALSSEESAFLLAGVTLLQVTTSQLVPTDERVQAMQHLLAIRNRLTDHQGSHLFTVPEWSLLRMAAEVQLSSDAPGAAWGAARKVQDAEVVVAGPIPSEQTLLSAANSLNTDMHLPQSQALRLNFTYGGGDGSGGQGYEEDHVGHHMLLTAAARYLSEGEQASVRLSWASEDRRAQHHLLTVESLSCGCGLGVWCPLTIRVTEPSHAQHRQDLTRAGAR